MTHDPGAELVDVLDDAGHVVGVVTRRVMRARRLPHRATYIFVMNHADELFVHLRTPTKDVYPSHWDVCVGGVLGAGESFDQGAAREVHEELGIVVPLVTLGAFRWADPTNDVHGMVYHVRHDGPFRLQPEEVVRGEFDTVEHVLARSASEPFCPDGLAALRQTLARNP